LAAGGGESKHGNRRQRATSPVKGGRSTGMKRMISRSCSRFRFRFRPSSLKLPALPAKQYPCHKNRYFTIQSVFSLFREWRTLSLSLTTPAQNAHLQHQVLGTLSFQATPNSLHLCLLKLLVTPACIYAYSCLWYFEFLELKPHSMHVFLLKFVVPVVLDHPFSVNLCLPLYKPHFSINFLIHMFVVP